MTLRRLQLTLLVTAAAALVVMLGLFPAEVRIACLAAVVAGTALTAGERLEPGGGWWSLLAAGTVLSVAGLAISAAAETAGGIVALVGSAAVIAGAAVGFPLADRT